MKVTIIGAGIGGLSTAISLKKFRPDLDIEIYESSQEMRAVGAGLGLAANAVMAFEQLGIKDQVLKQGNVLEKLLVLKKDGRRITETNHLAISRDYRTVSSFSIHRADLQEVLMNAADDIRLHLGKKVKRFDNEGSMVNVEFSDDSVINTDFVIACDGIHSVFRQNLAPGSGIRYAGYTCWRGVTDRFPEGLDPLVASETWSGGKRFGIVPLTRNRVYWFACINSEEARNPVFASYSKEDLLKSFSDFHHLVGETIRLTAANRIIWNDIIDFKPLERFAFGNILLLGDAAHATTPNMGQGACQAIEGAVILGKILVKVKDVKEAFKVFENKRLKRTRMIVERSWQIGKMAQLDNPVLEKIRDFTFSIIPDKMNKKQIEQIIHVNFEQV